MSSWPLNSLVVLALAGGALSPCAQAGDKIEFSAPGVSLGIPHVERAADKDSSKFVFQASIPGNDVFLDENVQASSEVVIITSPKRKDAKSWDSSFTDSRDRNSDADNSYDRFDYGQQSIDGATNRWGRQSDRNQDDQSTFSNRKSDELSRQGDLRTRLQAEITGRKTDYERNERYGSYYSKSEEDSASSSSFFHHESPGLERMGEGQFMPSYEEMKMLNDQSGGYSSVRPAGAEGSLSRRPTEVSGTTGYTFPGDIARGRTLDETAIPPRTYQPETRTVSQNADLFGPMEPPASPAGQVQSRPAVLPFPKKPGSVFQ
jgi:hypothetical protein